MGRGGGREMGRERGREGGKGVEVASSPDSSELRLEWKVLSTCWFHLSYRGDVKAHLPYLEVLDGVRLAVPPSNQ